MLNPKYEINQEVYGAHAYWLPDNVTCPDCLGTTNWSVTTPAGETFQVRCHTCNEGWYSSGKVRVYSYRPQVERLTIGSIRIDTNDEKPISYMCVETGVGSGTIHHEETLFPTYDEALAKAITLSDQYAKQKQEEEEKSRKRKKKEMVYKPKKTNAA